MTPINHSFTGPEIAKQVVGPMMGPMRSKTVSVKKCPTSCFVQIEAANSKWVITDSSSKLKIFNALSGICSPAYISVDGGRCLSIFVHCDALNKIFTQKKNLVWNPFYLTKGQLGLLLLRLKILLLKCAAF